jgi:hypothetical protein
MKYIIKKTLCALTLFKATESRQVSASIVDNQIHERSVSNPPRELNGPCFVPEHEQKQPQYVPVEVVQEQEQEPQEQQIQHEGKAQQQQQTREVDQNQEQQSEEKTEVNSTKLNSTIATKDDAKTELAFKGHSFTVGMQINTTKSGNINKLVLGEDLSAELYTYLWEELPNRYQIKQVTFDDVQDLSLELVRKLRKLEKSIKTHEFVVMGNVEFLTDEMPTANEVYELILNMKLSPASFLNSTNPILRSTVGAGFFKLQLRSSTSALLAPENEPAESSMLVDYNALIYLGSGMALLNVLAAVSYYAKSKNKSKDVNEAVSDDISLHVVEDESKDDDKFPGDKSLDGNGLLFIDSESASCSDDSLIEERGLHADTFSVCLPNRSVARKVVDEVADDTFTCGFEVPAPSQRRETKARPLDIDSVMCDSDSEFEERRKKRDYKLRATVVNEVVDNGFSCGFEVPARLLDIDTATCDDDSEYQNRRNRSGRKRNLEGDRSVMLVPRLQKGSKSSRRMYHEEKLRQRYEKPRNSDIFTVVTDETDGEGCVMVSPRQFVEDVVDEAIESCGMSLARY